MQGVGKLAQSAALARRASGKSYWRQINDLVSLAAGTQRLGFSEYYEFGIFDNAAFPGESKRDCVGWRASAQIDRQLNDSYWRAAANDKLLNYALLEHFGFPIPQTLASYSPQRRRIGSEQVLANREELVEFLSAAPALPLFVKPIHGSYGRGTHLLEAFDASTQAFTNRHGATIALTALAASCTTPQFNGMLFQACLQPHDRVRELAGSTTSCVRVIVAMTASGPEVHMTFWKIARTRNITDNFCMGETGNLLAWVNKSSGTIERVVTGLWPEGRDVENHPDTGAILAGASLPDWQQAMALCCSAALHFPGLRLQHWDVAFCVSGPVLMELNTEADLGVPQALGRRPFLNSTIKSMLERD